MTASLRLFLDLGDVFTKALVVDGEQTRRLRFPSVVAHQLVQQGAPATDLLIDERQELLRPEGFEEEQFPRSRSYPEATPLVEAARPVPRTRFAGWIAAAYGADRQMLGLHPTEPNVDALVHKALLSCATPGGEAHVTFVIDPGPKCESILQWARATPRRVRFLRHTVGKPEPERIELVVGADVVDAAECARAALEADATVPMDRAVLVLDVGYLRSKRMLLSPAGCEIEPDLEGAGVANVVRRILRDGQDAGLVEDELAVIRALERSQDVLEVQGRRFDVRAPLSDARRALEEELQRAVERTMADHFARHGEPFGALAVIGGGAALVGTRLRDRLTTASLGPAVVRVAPDDSHLMVSGAARRRTP